MARRVPNGMESSEHPEEHPVAGGVKKIGYQVARKVPCFEENVPGYEDAKSRESTKQP